MALLISAVSIFKNPERLRVFSSIAAGHNTNEKVQQSTNLPARSVNHYQVDLKKANLIVQPKEGAHRGFYKLTGFGARVNYYLQEISGSKPAADIVSFMRLFE